MELELVGLLLGIAAEVIKLYTIYQVLRRYYVIKEHGRSVVKYGASCALLVLVCFFSNIAGLFLLSCLFKMPWKKRIQIGLVFGIIFAFIEIIPTLLIDILTRSEMIAFLAVVLVLGTMKILRSIDKERNIETIEKVSFALLMGVPTISLIMCIVLIAAFGAYVTKVNILLLAFLTVSFLTFLYYIRIQEKKQEEANNEEYKRSLAIYANQIDTMKESYERLRGLRHDMKHHLLELKHYASVRDEKDMITYIEDMEQFMYNESEFVSTGNEGVDSTVNYLLRTAKDELKDVQVKVVLPQTLTISNFILNVVLGNLLENAIDAAKGSEQKYMKLDVRTKQGLLLINIENSFSGEIKTDDNEIKTKKKDEEVHGLGLKNIRHVVEERNGVISIEWKGNIFSVKVMLYLDEIIKK